MIEFSRVNYIFTTTSLAVNSNSLLAENIFNPDLNYQYFSDGFDNDLTTASIVLTFDATTTISKLALKDINYKEFKIFYNGLTANTLALTVGNTTTLSYISNSDTSMYFSFTTVQASSITIEAKSTQTANEEKVLGFFYVSDSYLTFDRIPAAGNYSPKVDAKQIVHEMSDGGTKIHNIAKKMAIDLSFKHLTLAEKDSLRTIYDLQDVFYFCPFPTTTAWDGILFEANWVGDFDFEKYSDNAIASGFSGAMKLKET